MTPIILKDAALGTFKFNTLSINPDNSWNESFGPDPSERYRSCECKDSKLPATFPCFFGLTMGGQLDHPKHGLLAVRVSARFSFSGAGLIVLVMGYSVKLTHVATDKEFNGATFNEDVARFLRKQDSAPFRRAILNAFEERIQENQKTLRKLVVAAESRSHRQKQALAQLAAFAGK